MKLDELKGIKSYQYATGRQLMMRLTSNGVFKKALGRGNFAIAFELSNGEVLKTWSKDEAYEKYLEYASKHHSNPYVVRTLGKIQTYKMKHATEDSPQEMKYVRLEKLEIPTSLKPFGYNSSSYDAAESILDRVIDAIYKYKTLDNRPDFPELFKELSISETRASDKFKEFLDAAFQIGGDLLKMGLHLDIGLGNFGLRGDQVVFLDPVTSAPEKSIKLDTVLKT